MFSFKKFSLTFPRWQLGGGRKHWQYNYFIFKKQHRGVPNIRSPSVATGTRNPPPPKCFCTFCRSDSNMCAGGHRRKKLDTVHISQFKVCPPPPPHTHTQHTDPSLKLEKLGLLRIVRLTNFSPPTVNLELKRFNA